MLNFPENINRSDFDYNKLGKEEHDKTMRYMRAYFDLCSEEYDLWNNNHIEKRIWENWESGIEYAFSKKAFQEAWKIISFDTMYYPEFATWINGMIKKNK